MAASSALSRDEARAVARASREISELCRRAVGDVESKRSMSTRGKSSQASLKAHRVLDFHG